MGSSCFPARKVHWRMLSSWLALQALVVQVASPTYKVIWGYTPEQLQGFIADTPEGFYIDPYVNVDGQDCHCRISSSSSVFPGWSSVESSNPVWTFPPYESSFSSSSSPPTTTTTTTPTTAASSSSSSFTTTTMGFGSGTSTTTQTTTATTTTTTTATTTTSTETTTSDLTTSSTTESTTTLSTTTSTETTTNTWTTPWTTTFEGTTFTGSGPF